MLSVSLHGISITAPIGLYPQEKLLANTFEVDVDVKVAAQLPWPFVDYTLIRTLVSEAFASGEELLEAYVEIIHRSLRIRFPDAVAIRVCVRKLHPPMPGSVAYAQVCLEQ